MQDHCLDLNNLDINKNKTQFCNKELTELLKSENETHNETHCENHIETPNFSDQIHLPQLYNK